MAHKKGVGSSRNGKAPVSVAGKLRGGRTSIAAFTSQYLSSLLLCTPLAQADTDIEVTLLNEPGYVQMTLDWLDKQGIQYENDGLRRFRMGGGQSYRAYDLPWRNTLPSAERRTRVQSPQKGRVTEPTTPISPEPSR